jgi:hypothetical protein
MWLTMAERAGYNAAARYLPNAASRMDPQQLAQVRERMELLPG